MILKGLIDTDFVNYKVPCMVLEFPKCSFKCDKECGQPVCQNNILASAPDIQIDVRELFQRYTSNPITEAIVCQGLEPFDSWDDLYGLVYWFKGINAIKDDIVIYTGYTKKEITDELEKLSQFDGIVIKFGRYIPNRQSHYDNVLGVYLASDNQYGERMC